MTEPRGLGKGIRALIPQSTPTIDPLTPLVNTQDLANQVTKVLLSSIRLNRFQPRQTLDESKVQELANSIRESGLIYPLLVRKIEKSGVTGPDYEIIAGERRYRALKAIGETEAPVLVRQVDDRKALELSLIENVQRQELNPMEEAMAYQRLISEFHLTQEQVAAAVGKDRATIANTLRLLKLAAPVRAEVVRGRLTLGHARAICALESERAQKELADKVIAQGLSVRQTENLAKSAQAGVSRTRAKQARDPHLVSAEQKLQRALGTNVQIFHGRSRGWIRIAYYSLKDFDRILGKLGA